MKEMLGKLKRILINLGIATMFIVVLVLMMSLIIFGNKLAGGVDRPVYNCSIAEFSPDFTTKMREECRKQRMMPQNEKDILRKSGTTV